MQICPDPFAHIPECVEQDYDRRGDCHGEMKHLVLNKNYAGGHAGDDVYMCASHATQAVRKGEARRTGGRVPLPA